MRLVRQDIDQSDGSGSATLLPEEPEDMWHAYNLIQVNDLLRATAIRKVVTESATGSTTSQRVHTTLSIGVTKTDFDATTSQLHVSGKITAQNAVAQAGSHHTLDLELNRQFTLSKAGGWDSIALQQLHEAVDTKARANIWAVVMQEGEASIAFITDHQTVLRQRVAVTIPSRGPSSTATDKALARFHKTLADTLFRQLELTNNSFDKTSLKPLLLASPGFAAQNFLAYLKKLSQEGNNKALIALLPLITVTHSSSANLSSLHEVMKSPAILSKLRDTRFARETVLMDNLMDSIRKEDGKAHYGLSTVRKIVDKGAVGRGGGVLLISDRLFRAQVIAERRRWVDLVDKVRDIEGGEVRVLSAVHESGQRLETLGGVAALSTYPIFEEDSDTDSN